MPFDYKRLRSQSACELHSKKPQCKAHNSSHELYNMQVGTFCCFCWPLGKVISPVYMCHFIPKELWKYIAHFELSIQKYQLYAMYPISISPTCMKFAKMRKLFLVPLHALVVFRSPLHERKKQIPQLIRVGVNLGMKSRGEKRGVTRKVSKSFI